MKEKTIVYEPASITEMQTLLKNNQQILPLGGATEFLQGQIELPISLPHYLLSLSNIKELSEINKTERYIDLGAMVTLGHILDLGEKNIPPLLYSSLRTIASKNARSLATVGGNLALSRTLKTLYPVMMSLDTRVEIKTGTETFWEPYSKYASDEFVEIRKKPYVITRVRIYTEHWSYSFFERLGKKGVLDNETAYFVFLIKGQKNLISDVRISYSSEKFFRSREFEEKIKGQTLPFSMQNIEHILSDSKKIFTSEIFSQKFQELIFFNLLEKCILDLNHL